MVEGSQPLTQVADAIREAVQTIRQAEASRNIQQIFEARRVLYLAQQRLAHAQKEMSQAGDREDDEQSSLSVEQALVDGKYIE